EPGERGAVDGGDAGGGERRAHDVADELDHQDPPVAIFLRIEGDEGDGGTMTASQHDHDDQEPATPLEGVRVVDLSSGLAGAYCTKMLVDVGASVVLVEPEGGHPLRRRTASGA